MFIIILLEYINVSYDYLDSAMKAKTLLENQNILYIISPNMKQIEKHFSLKLYILIHEFKKYYYGQLKVRLAISFSSDTLK
jgi:hypothetical protein